MKRRNYPASLAMVASFFSLPFSLLAQGSVNPQKTAVDARYQTEVKTLAAQPVVKAAFRAILEQEPATMQNLVRLTQIPAPPFKEEARAKAFRQLLQEAGADSIWTDQAGNVLALRRGKKEERTVVIEGHLDTVFPEGTDVTVKHHGDTLYAPGVGDDTRGLAVVLSLLTAMNKAGVKTAANILFAGTTGEEGLGDLRGVKELFRSGPKIDAYISIDGGSLGSLVYGAVGSRRYRIAYKGQGGHSYGAFGLANPHNATAHAMHHFTLAADSFTRKGIKATYNLGVLGGGTSVNAIPFESWMEVDLRSEDLSRLNGLDSLLQQAIRRGLQEENQRKRLGQDLSVSVTLVGDRPTGSQDASLALVQRAAAASQFLGRTPQPRVSSTNANIPISKGIPGITIWQGGESGGAHSLNEWWLNKDGHLAIQAALLLLLSEAGLAN